MAKAPVVLFLGAGASAFGFPTTKKLVENIGLDPFDKDILSRNFGDRAEFLRKIYEKIQIKDIEGVYNFLRAYENTPEIKLMSERFQETNNQEGRRVLRTYLRDISRFERIINNILHSSYDYRPKDHEKEALSIYGPLFDLLLSDNIMGDLSELPIFTTNYDIVIEKMFEMPFIRDNCVFTDGFKLEERTGAWIYDDFEYTRLGTNEKPIIKLYKLHGSINWATRKNDNALVKFPGLGPSPHTAYDSPVIAYPGEHNIKQRDEFKILNAHFEQDLRKAEICIVSGFSFRDYNGINQLFRQVMGKDNKKLFVEISGLRPKLSGDAANLFNQFTRRYDYHSGGIEKLETLLRRKYKNISDRVRLNNITFVGNKLSHKYHLSSCYWAKQIHTSNQVLFSSIENAHQQGYIPCNVCKPT